jgi:uncharacterized protein (UPF0332 family)
MAKRRFVPTWRDWVRNETICFRSVRYFERVGAIKKLGETIARDDVLGHLRKANHNLRLANRLFEMQENSQFDFKYEGETNFDWVVAVSYYAMYQSCLGALAAVRKSGEAHAATVCALIYYYFHKKKRLNEQYLISLDRIKALASQDIQKLTVGKDQREKASYDSSFSTQRGIAQVALTDAREFVTRIREILEDGFGPEFMKGV